MLALWLVQYPLLGHVDIGGVRLAGVYLLPNLFDHVSRPSCGNERIVRQMQCLECGGLPDCSRKDLHHLGSKGAVVEADMLRMLVVLDESGEE